MNWPGNPKPPFGSAFKTHGALLPPLLRLRIRNGLAWPGARAITSRTSTKALGLARSSLTFAPEVDPPFPSLAVLQRQMARSTHPGLYMLRIPKTGSTASLKALLQMGRELELEVLRVDWPRALAPVTLGQLASCDVLIGHLANAPAAYFPFREWQLVTTIRDPVERFISQWRQLRLEARELRLPGRLRSEALGLSVEGWLRTLLAREGDLNEQALWLVCPPVLDERPTESCSAQLSTSGHAQLRLPSDREQGIILHQAEDALASAFLVGPASAATEVARLAVARYADAPPPSMAKPKLEYQDASSGLAAQLPTSLLGELQERTQLDRRLYALACELWAEQTQATSH